MQHIDNDLIPEHIRSELSETENGCKILKTIDLLYTENQGLRNVIIKFEAELPELRKQAVKQKELIKFLANSSLFKPW